MTVCARTRENDMELREKDLDKLREDIDGVDESIMELFDKRMRISEEIARYKKENGLPVTDIERERKKINAMSDSAPDDLKTYSRVLYSLLAEMSKEHQRTKNKDRGRYYELYERAMKKSDRVFPTNVTAACFGSEGTYAQMACDQFFGMPVILYFKKYEGVISAVAKGLCGYGVIPIETGSHGSNDAVYDLLVENGLSIVRSIKVRLDYNIAAPRKLTRHEITELYTTAEARANCGAFLSKFENIRLVMCDNEAAAAKMAKESKIRGAAAITTYRCAMNYDLEIVEDSIQAEAQRTATFICVARDFAIYPGADKTSLMITMENRPGELYKVLSKFFVLGINVTKIETRTMPNRDFETRLYLDFKASVYSVEFKELIARLDDFGKEIHYLGSYPEI